MEGGVDVDAVRAIRDEAFGGFIGQERAKQQIDDLINATIADAERREMGVPVDRNYHVVFSGNPGTGKTTMAELIGRVYHALGIVPSAKVHTVMGTAMISNYKNETPKKVTEHFDKAKGGVLFIDEAYGMVTPGENEAGKQAVDTLNDLVLKNKDTVVIMAGYPGAMGDVFALNEGMDRRFPTTIDFKDFTQAERMDILRGAMSSSKVAFATKPAEAAAKDALLDTGRGNAGDVMNLWQKVLQAQSNRVAPSLAGASPQEKARLMGTVTLADVKDGHARFLAEARVQSPLRLVAVPTGVKRAPRKAPA